MISSGASLPNIYWRLIIILQNYPLMEYPCEPTNGTIFNRMNHWLIRKRHLLSLLNYLFWTEHIINYLFWTLLIRKGYPLIIWRRHWTWPTMLTNRKSFRNFASKNPMNQRKVRVAIWGFDHQHMGELINTSSPCQAANPRSEDSHHDIIYYPKVQPGTKPKKLLNAPLYKNHISSHIYIYIILFHSRLIILFHVWTVYVHYFKTQVTAGIFFEKNRQLPAATRRWIRRVRVVTLPTRRRRRHGFLEDFWMFCWDFNGKP